VIISLIAALGRNRVIGLDDGLPWHMPTDARHFRTLTEGKPVVMGRKTFQSLKGPLARRTNIVLTRSEDFRPPGCVVVDSVEAALAAAGDCDELMIAGGAEVYERFLPCADRMYLTFIDGDFPGDTHFPAYDPEQWTETERRDFEADERNPYPFSFVTLERRRARR
jgi:dihydrofolate reductase